MVNSVTVLCSVDLEWGQKMQVEYKLLNQDKYSCEISEVSQMVKKQLLNNCFQMLKGGSG